MDYTALDQEELFRLAINAMENQQHAEAIALLKQGVLNDGADARLHYLLGAEYAQIGMPDRAAASMEQAVALQPGLVMAVFQLGLLYLTQGLPDKAEQCWLNLAVLPDEHPLQVFRRALTHLIRDEFSLCRDAIHQGIAANQAFPALNNDMQQLLSLVEAQLAASAAVEDAPNDTGEPRPAGSSLFLRGYAASSDEPLH